MQLKFVLGCDMESCFRDSLSLFWHLLYVFVDAQTLAIYDRFGRLAYGSENLAKDSLEYVVFEKHISDEYGSWRIHGKIIPDWMPPGQQTVIRTMRKPNFEPLTEDNDTDSNNNSKTADSGAAESPAVATAWFFYRLFN